MKIKSTNNEIELILSHNGKYWIAKNSTIKFSSAELSNLENNIKKTLYVFFKNNKINQLKVFLRYDFDNFPKWLRQYHSHYFNRILTISF